MITKKNKRGLSEIIAYVLLILIAVSIAGVVYVWLQGQIPKGKTSCPEGVSISIEAYTCNNAIGKINITFENRGLFNIDGANVLISNVTDVIPSQPITALSALGQSVQEAGFAYFTPSLLSGKNYFESFDYSVYNTITEIQVIPFVFSENIGKDVKANTLILCKNSVIRQKVTCT